VGHTFRYCLGVPRNLRESGPVSVVTNPATDGPSSGLKVGMTHDAHPGWIFFVWVTAKGQPAGFEIAPADSWRQEAPPRYRELSKQPRPVPKAITHRADDPREMPADAPPITARFLRQIPLGQLQAVAVLEWRALAEASAARLAEREERSTKRAPVDMKAITLDKLYDHLETARSEASAADLRVWASGLNKRPGRRGRSARDYAAIAALYVDAYGSGTEVKDVADALGYSTASVRNFLSEARRRGLLTRVGQGRAGGELTAEAIELLKGDD